MMMEFRYVPSADSTKYNDHLTEMAHFNTVPVVTIFMFSGLSG